MSHNNENEPWNALEVSYLYHLINWGYTSQEACDIAAKLLTQRPYKGIAAQVSVLRKHMSKQKGFKVSNYNTGGRLQKIFKQAAKIAATEQLLKFKPQIPSDFIHTRLVSVTPKRRIENIPPTPTPPNSVQPAIEYHQPQPESCAVTSDIIQVMRLAKELGSVEVEYKGIKIKF